MKLFFFLIPPVALASPPGPYYSGQQFSTGKSPVAVVACDWNQDGRSDLVSADSNSNTVSVLLGQADGTYLNHAGYGTGSLPVALAAGDLDGDGDEDLSVACATSNSVTVLFGDGIGGLQSVASWPVGSTPASIAMADWNLDGRNDLAIANRVSNDIFLGLNSGGGNFIWFPSISFMAPSCATPFFGLLCPHPVSIAAGDFNNDSIPDLAIGLMIVTVSPNPAQPSQIAIHLGAGNGLFVAAGNAPLAIGAPSIVVGDWNGDGNLDAAATTGGIFPAFTGSLVSLLGDGLGGIFPLNPVLTPVGTKSSHLAAGDIDADGFLDLLATNAGNYGASADVGDLRVFRGNGTGLFSFWTKIQTPGTPAATVLEDLNQDGRIDFASVCKQGSSLSVFLNDGKPLFGPENLSFPWNPGSVAVGDLNEDGKEDLLVAGWNVSGSHFAVLLSQAQGKFTQINDTPCGPASTAPTLADLDLDGKLDFALLDNAMNRVAVFLGKGNGGFHRETDYPTGPQPSALNTGDLNGDGWPDLAVVDSGGVSVLIAKGAGRFFPPITYPMQTHPLAPIFLGDWNGDGNLDAITLEGGANAGIAVLLGNGAGALAAPAQFSYGNFGANTLTIGDWNADGALDFAVAGTLVTYPSGSLYPVYVGQLAILLGNGLGGASAPSIQNTVDAPTSLVTVDVDGDGKLDLASSVRLGFGLPGAVAIHRGDGAGQFAAPWIYGVNQEPFALVHGDFDADGRPDFVTANSGSQDISLLMSQTTGPFAVSSTVGIQLFGAGTPGCAGAHGLQSLTVPKIGAHKFEMLASNAPPLSVGFGLIADQADFLGSYPFSLGVKFHIDLFASSQMIPVNFVSDVQGVGRCAFPIPFQPALIGATYYSQVFWSWPLSQCSLPPANLSSSNGLEITLQAP